MILVLAMNCLFPLVGRFSFSMVKWLQFNGCGKSNLNHVFSSSQLRLNKCKGSVVDLLFYKNLSNFLFYEMQLRFIGTFAICSSNYND